MSLLIRNLLTNNISDYSHTSRVCKTTLRIVFTTLHERSRIKTRHPHKILLFATSYLYNRKRRLNFVIMQKLLATKKLWRIFKHNNFVPKYKNSSLETHFHQKQHLYITQKFPSGNATIILRPEKN